MALVQISPIEARVRWDRRADRPAEVRWRGHHHRVVELDAVRDERSAYPADRGPRLQSARYRPGRFARPGCLASEDDRGPMDERLTDLTVRHLIERLATSDPVPGGGSAAALAGGVGAGAGANV